MAAAAASAAASTAAAAAASAKEGEKQVNKTLSTLLRQLYEVEAILADFTQPNSQQLLATRMQELVAGLAQLKQQVALFSHMQVPTALLKFVDEGGHPDDFVRIMFRTAVADNQIAAGRVAALRSMRQELADAAAAAYPSEAAVYKAVMAQKQEAQQALEQQKQQQPQP